MARWVWKRRVWAVLTGAVVATGAAATAADLPKANDKITLRFEGQPERTVTVVKATRKPDGTVETEVKDAKTGETFTLRDGPAAATPVVPAAGSKATPAPAGARPPVAMPPAPLKTGSDYPTTAEPPRDNKRPILNRLLNLGRDPEATPERPGLFNRLFGSRKPAAPAEMPAPVTTAPPLAAPAPVATPAAPAAGSTGEPPRSVTVTPAQPLTPPPAPGRSEPVVVPTPAVPAPPPLPTSTPGSIPVPAQMPAPGATPPPAASSAPATVPAPVSVPAVPVPPVPSVPVPTIPTPLPGGSIAG